MDLYRQWRARALAAALAVVTCWVLAAVTLARYSVGCAAVFSAIPVFVKTFALFILVGAACVVGAFVLIRGCATGAVHAVGSNPPMAHQVAATPQPHPAVKRDRPHASQFLALSSIVCLVAATPAALVYFHHIPIGTACIVMATMATLAIIMRIMLDKYVNTMLDKRDAAMDARQQEKERRMDLQYARLDAEYAELEASLDIHQQTTASRLADIQRQLVDLKGTTKVLRKDVDNNRKEIKRVKRQSRA